MRSSRPIPSIAARLARARPWRPLLVLSLGFAGNSYFAATARAQATALDSTATVTWTAPGDDGVTGRASRYELRMRNAAIAGTDTLSWWNAATGVPGMPSPGVAGTVDSVLVHGLDPTHSWWFVLRTADEVPNWSGFSNVAVRAPYVDTIPPAAIVDLRLAATAAAPPGTAPAPAR